MQKILLTTPTGQIGSKVFENLKKVENIQVTVIVRNPKKVDISRNHKIIKGSLDDDGVLESALEDIDTLFWCLPPDGKFANIQEHYEGMANIAAKAIKNSNLKNIVSISSGGKGKAEDAGFISALHIMEDILNETGKSFKHLRNGNFMENYLRHIPSIKHQSKFIYPMQGNYKVPTVAVKDIANVATKWLLDTSWNGQSGVGVHGPAELSCDDIAERLSYKLQKQISYEEVSEKVFREMLKKFGADNDFIENYCAMFREIEKGIYLAEPRSFETTTPTTFESWSEEVFIPLYNS